jgi:hypothetical protein
VALVRWTPATVDALVLADSPVVLFTDLGPTVLTDDRIARLGGKGRLRGDVAAASLRNAEGGFWVAEADPAAARMAVTMSLPRAGVRAALLASDGVSCGVDDYGLFDWPGLLARCETDGPESVVDAIHTAERADGSRTRWPRSKVHDDKALAVVRFAYPDGT